MYIMFLVDRICILQNCMLMLHADDLYVHNMSDKSVRHDIVVLGRFVHSVVRFFVL